MSICLCYGVLVTFTVASSLTVTVMMNLWQYFVPVSGSFAFLLAHGRPCFLRILFVGDVFGQAGRRIVSEDLRHHGLLWVVLKQLLPRLRKGQGSLILLEHRQGATWNSA
jgi:hypothetical protein